MNSGDTAGCGTADTLIATHTPRLAWMGGGSSGRWAKVASLMATMDGYCYLVSIPWMEHPSNQSRRPRGRRITRHTVQAPGRLVKRFPCLEPLRRLVVDSQF